MYRRSLNRIVKIKLLGTSVKLGGFHRCCQSGYVKLFSLSKNDEIRKTKNSYVLTRNFSSDYSKKNKIEARKSVQVSRNIGIDMKAPDFRNNNFVIKSASKNQKETCGQFHTKPSKWITLKMCKNLSTNFSKNLSTFQLKAPSIESGKSNENGKDKTRNDCENIETMADKADICRTICNPNSSIHPKEIDTSPNSNSSISPKENIRSTTSSSSISPTETVTLTTSLSPEENIQSTTSPNSNSSISPKDTVTLNTSILPKEIMESNTSSNPNSSISPKENIDSTTSLNANSSILPKDTVALTAWSNPNSSISPTETIESNSLISSKETVALTTSPNHKSTERIIDQLTDAEIEEICRMKCPCKNCNADAAVQSKHYQHPKSNRGWNTKQPLDDNEDSSIISSKKAKTRKNRIDERSSQVRKMILPKLPDNKNDQRFMPPNQYGNIPHDMPNNQRQRFPIHPAASAQHNMTGTRNDFQQTPTYKGFKVGPQMRPAVYRAPSQLKSKYERMIRSQAKQIKNKMFGMRPTPERNISHAPRVIVGFQPTKKQNAGHFERPMYTRYVSAPYKPGNQQLIRRRQRMQQIPGVYGKFLISKNKQTPFGLQSNIPNWNLDQAGIRGGVAAPISNNILNIDKSKALVTDLNSGKCSSDTKLNKVDPKLMHNRSVIIEGPEKLKLITSSYPKLRDEKDVIIQMEYVNLTDADRQHYLTGRYNPYSYATTVIGRTGSGTIIEIGNSVHNFKPGDKVFVKPVSCGKCSLCLSDRRNLCEYVSVNEASTVQGTLSRFHVHSSEFITKIPYNVNLLHAAMTWTLSSAIRACQKAGISAGDVVMVIGGGALGMATTLAVQSMGATTVCLSDIHRRVLDEAQKFGIDRAYLIDLKSPIQNTAIKIWENIGEYPRLTFDCRGSQLTNQIAVAATKTGGKVIVMNSNDRESILSISNVITRDIDIIISTVGNDESDIAALRFLSKGKFLINSNMHHYYDLSNVNEAFQHLLNSNRLDSQIIVKCSNMDDAQEKKEKTE